MHSLQIRRSLNRLPCESPTIIETQWLAYWPIRRLMVRWATLAKVLLRQFTFKHSLQFLLPWSRWGVSPDKLWMEFLLILIAPRRVRCRPGRIQPRTIDENPNRGHSSPNHVRSCAKRYEDLDIQEAASGDVRHEPASPMAFGAEACRGSFSCQSRHLADTRLPRARKGHRHFTAS